MEKPEVITPEVQNDGEQVIKIDVSEAMMKLWENQTKTIVESLLKKMDEKVQGKGVVTVSGNDATKLVEELHKIREPNWKLTEQWTVVIPNLTSYEISAHLRNYVFVSNILNSEGDVANIPYVDDFDFEILGSVGAAFAGETTSIIGTYTTTLYEAGAWTDVGYYLIERIDQNLLEELNSRFAVAAVRAEDKKIMQLISAVTAVSFAGNVTRITATLNAFYSSNITHALNLLMTAGKDVKPGECLLYMTPGCYGALLNEMVASTPMMIAMPSVLQKGFVEELFGVKIVVGGYRPYQQRTNAATGTVDLCFLMRPKRAVALAPKRELLVETQKLVDTRELRITGSHSFAIKILDYKEIVRIWTAQTQLGTS